MPEIVSKSQFARLVNRNPSQVTRWIEDGKIFGPALDGEGRGARIVVSEAKHQLGLTLDASQQMAQPTPLLDLEAPAGSGAPVVDTIKRDHLEARNRKMVADATRAEIELAEMRGTLVDAQLVRAEFNERMNELVGWVDSLPDVIGNPLAEAFNLDKVDFRIQLRRLIAQERVRLIAQIRGSLGSQAAVQTVLA